MKLVLTACEAPVDPTSVKDRFPGVGKVFPSNHLGERWWGHVDGRLYLAAVGGGKPVKVKHEGKFRGSCLRWDGDAIVARAGGTIVHLDGGGTVLHEVALDKECPGAFLLASLRDGYVAGDMHQRWAYDASGHYVGEPRPPGLFGGLAGMAGGEVFVVGTSEGVFAFAIRDGAVVEVDHAAGNFSATMRGRNTYGKRAPQDWFQFTIAG